MAANKKVTKSVTHNRDGNREKKRTQTNPNSLANLKPFQPGQSGNPGGRPKRKLISDALKDMLEKVLESGDHTQAEAIGVAMIAAAISGDVKAATFVRDTVEGKPLQKIEMKRDEFSGRSEDELRFYVDNGCWPEEAAVVRTGNA